jgi:hypothetical protein
MTGSAISGKAEAVGANAAICCNPAYRSAHADYRLGCDFAFSRHDASELFVNIRPRNRGRGATLENRGRGRPSIEGAGNAGCPKHPRPVCESSVHTVVTTVAPEHPAFPHAMVLTAYATLSPATNSSCHRRRRIGGVANPGWARNTSAGLAPATGARTTWFCRTRPVFARRLRRHVHVRPSIDEAGSNIVRPRAGPMLTGTRSIERPPCNALRDDAAASTASRPNVRDDGQRPSLGTGWRGTKG